MKELILGGVRSGKSRLAEQRAHASGLTVVYIATATVGDDAEMAQRIAAHRARRPSHWHLVEESLHLATVLQQHAQPQHCLLVECLTLWLTNLLLSDATTLQQQRDALLACLPSLAGHIIFVGNETNMGITPLGELSRRYCDEAGQLHQQLAQLCDRVMLTIAGLPLILKGEPLCNDLLG